MRKFVCWNGIFRWIRVKWRSSPIITARTRFQIEIEPLIRFAGKQFVNSSFLTVSERAVISMCVIKRHHPKTLEAHFLSDLIFPQPCRRWRQEARSKALRENDSTGANVEFKPTPKDLERYASAESHDFVYKLFAWTIYLAVTHKRKGCRTTYKNRESLQEFNGYWLAFLGCNEKLLYFAFTSLINRPLIKVLSWR